MKTRKMTFADFVAEYADIPVEDILIEGRVTEVNGKIVESADDEVEVYFGTDFGLNNWALSEPDDSDDDEPWDGFRDDVEADADALASAGWGTDEDYGGGCEYL